MPQSGPKSPPGIEVRGRLAVWSPLGGPQPRVQMLVTTRHGGVSSSPWDTLNLSPSTGDEREDVEANRQRLQDDTGMPTPRWLHQVHGDVVVDAADLGAIPGGTLQADGLWTQENDVALAVGIADCVPIFLWDRSGARIAVVHAGWRGTAKRIVQRGIEVLRAAGSQRQDLRLTLGPSIGPCCYEVGGMVTQKLPSESIRREAHGTYADLRAANRIVALESGLEAHQIDPDPPCTACHTDWFFSHRRQGPATGRMWAVAWLRGAGA